MAPDGEMVIIFGALHLSALLLAGVLFSMFMRSGPQNGRSGEDEDEGGGGGNDRIGTSPKSSPPGGLPLPDAEPAPVRLRGHERLRDLRPHPARRPAEHPQPTRRRVPSR
jgi:hypothetical protein